MTLKGAIQNFFFYKPLTVLQIVSNTIIPGFPTRMVYLKHDI